MPKVLHLLIFIFQTANANEDFNYFHKNIDYWNQKTNEIKTKDVPTDSLVLEKEKKTVFDWKKHLDPTNKDFFKEGDYSPPEPFIELAKNPTDENIKNWFKYMELKNELSQKLQYRIQEYLKNKNSPKINVEIINGLIDKLPHPRANASSFRIRMYFDSKCPHCKRMFETLLQLQKEGYFVETFQIDQDPVGALPLPTRRAPPEDIQNHKIESVPFVLIADLKRKVILPALKGYHTREEIHQLLDAVSETK